jgi:ribosomal protein S12 methylthiotransferase
LSAVPRVHIQTLGCAKNAVDSDKAVARLRSAGWDECDSAATADLVVVNTCSFIGEARRESVDAVLAARDAASPGARVVVMGCLAERYGTELADAVAGIEVAGIEVAGFEDYPALLRSFGDDSGPRSSLEFFDLPDRPAPDVPWAYVKVAEGCDRTCAFCAIPLIRGKQRSRRPESIELEVRGLVAGGASEIVLVAQDLVWFGKDMGEPGSLLPLLQRLSAIDGVRRVRLLYLYPSGVSEALIAEMAANPVVMPYFDLSLQHADKGALSAMRRWGSGEQFLSLLARVRDAVPDAAFRSTFIVGHPGETDAGFDTLCEFVAEARLDWMGFFPWSPEEGTAAFASADQAPSPAEVRDRLGEVEALADAVMAERAASFVGRALEVLVDRPGEGRSYREAPEVDGLIRLPGGQAGEYRSVTIEDAWGTELRAR